MSVESVLTPVFVLVALAFALLFRMGSARFAAFRAKTVRISQETGLPVWPEPAAKISAAFHNQLQMPVFFYLVVLVALMTKKADLIFVILEWLFVATRIAHAFIHTGYNHIPHRFAAFLAGVTILMVMWIVTAGRILLA